MGDLTCRSEGSVGLDETVAITLRLAIPDKWVEGQPLLWPGFKGQSARDPDRRHAPAGRRWTSGRWRVSRSSCCRRRRRQAVGGELE